MRRLFIIPRMDVLFFPRDWRFKRYPRGIVFSIGGSYSHDGTGQVATQWFRIGPPCPSRERA